MRRVAPVAVAGALMLVLAGCGGSDNKGSDNEPAASSDKAGARTVTTKLLSFTPGTLTVKAGTTVTWHAGDGITHTVTTGTYQVGSDKLRSSEKPDGKLDKPLKQGTDVTFTFAEPGKYSYFCSIHKGMNGEVDVTP
jgi:plastocyanin